MKRKKKSPRASAKELLDSVFSKWIRLKNADENGYCKCITCSVVLHWKEITNGHYVKRNVMGTRYVEENCGPQCWGCNAKHLGDGRKDEHALHIMRKYGPEQLEKLNQAKHRTTKFHTYDLTAMIAVYNRELEALQV